MTIEEIKKVHESFQPLLLTALLNSKLTAVTKNRKAKDDAQKQRLQDTMAILKSGVVLPGFPDKTATGLLQQLEAQLAKVQGNK